MSPLVLESVSTTSLLLFKLKQNNKAAFTNLWAQSAFSLIVAKP